MNLGKKLSLRQRLMITGTILAAGPLVLLGIVTQRQFSQMVTMAEENSAKLAEASLDRVTDTAYKAIENSQVDPLQPLKLANGMLAGYGGLNPVRFRRTTWHVTNPATHETTTRSLPVMSIGITGRRMSRSAAARPAFVDQVHQMADVSCSVYQRMDASGSMLKIATSDVTADGKRARGTAVPATNADGTPSVLIEKILQKQQFVEKTSAGGEPVLVAYAPVTRKDGEVIGMLSVGMPQNAGLSKALDALSRIDVPKDGKLFALNAASPNRGKLLFSTGRVTLDAQSTDAILRAALEGPNGITRQHFQSAHDGTVLVHARLLAQSNLVLGVVAPQQSVAGAVYELRTIPRQSYRCMAYVLFASILGSALIWWRRASTVVRPVAQYVDRMKADIRKLADFSKQIALAAQEQIQRAGQQILELQKTAQTTATLNQVTQRNAEQIDVALTAASDSDIHSKHASEHLHAMQTSISEISNSNTRMTAIMKSIDDIAFQSRILALNASIEAARAGAAGASFAVVADEFGTLAHRCADAARDTTELLTGCVSSARSGADNLSELATAVTNLAANTATMKSLIGNVHSTNQEQVRAISQISSSVTEMESAAQSNAARIEEGLGAGAQVRAQSVNLWKQTEALASSVQSASRPKRRSAKKPTLVASTTITLPKTQRSVNVVVSRSIPQNQRA